MVAEAVAAPVVEEKPVPQPEEVAPSTPEVPVVPVEAAEVETPPEPSALDTAHEAFLRELGASAEVTTPGTEGKPALAPEAEEEVERRVNETLTAAQRQAQQLGQINYFRDSTTHLRNWAQQRNLDPADTNVLVEFFNQYHNVGQQVTKLEASEAAAAQTVTDAYAAAAKVLGLKGPQANEFIGARGNGHKGPEDTMKAIVELARKGFVSESEAKARTSAALVKYKAEVVDPIVGKAPPREGGGAGVYGDQPRTYAEAEAWHASDRWTTGQWKAYKATHSR